VVVRRVVVEPDTADRDVRHAVRDHVLDLHVRHLRGELVELHDAEFGEIRAADHTAGDTDIVEVLLAPLRGHNDFLECAALGLRKGRQWAVKNRRDGGRERMTQWAHGWTSVSRLRIRKT